MENLLLTAFFRPISRIHADNAGKLICSNRFRPIKGLEHEVKSVQLENSFSYSWVLTMSSYGT